MHILIALTYYRPHYSGLTIYAERLARSLVARGHRVTVLTSRFSKDLPRFENCQGVEVIRLDVLMRISKGVIMPGILWWALRLIRKVDVVNLHVPQLDAAPISLIARLLRKPVVVTYHCDLLLPQGFIHAMANRVSRLANHVSARSADVIVTNTRDYAENSAFLKQYLAKIRPVYPPVELAPVNEADVAAFRRKAKIEAGQRIIGMVARLATEKGVEYLLQALPVVLERYPQARVLFVGQYENVLGEEQYAQKLKPLIEELNDHWSFLGILTPEELTVFFREADVTVLPSINETESFGMVQVEAMTCGTPVIATDLPGVRVPVQVTGMGRVVAPADSQRLAQALLEVLSSPADFNVDRSGTIREFSSTTVAQKYEAFFQELAGTKKDRKGKN